MSPWSPLATPGALAIGQDFDSPAPPYNFDPNQAFNGTIDEFAVFDRILSQTEFEAQVNVGAIYERIVVDLEPQLYWTFGESSGTTATKLGAIGVTGDGTYGSAVILGEDSLVENGCDTALGLVKDEESRVLLESYSIPDTDVFVSFWVQGEDDGLSHFFGYASANASNEFTFASNDGSFRALVNGGFVEYPEIDVLDSTPHHVGIARSGSTGNLSIFLDGRRMVMEAFPAGPLATPGALAIGQDFDNSMPPYGFDGAEALDGIMDEFAIFDRILTPAEIVPLANQGILGDVNCDGAVNLLDVGPFIDLISSGGYSVKADTNGDGVINLLDVAPFIDLVSTGG